MTQRLVVFDLETTGVDVEEDRIVTAFIAVLEEDGTVSDAREWLVNPGVTIPDAAIAVHGVTNERARREGVYPTDALTRITRHLNDLCVRECLPLAGMNLTYDLSLLDREVGRYFSGPGVKNWLEDGKVNVLDAYVLDKKLSPARRGGRKLIDLVHYYHLHLDGAAYHDARFDAIAAGRVVQKQLESDLLRGIPLDAIHEAQVYWHQDQAVDFEKWKRRTEPGFIANREWPIITRKKEAA